MEWCIEGDVVGAFNNVYHNRLIEILNEKITDTRFLVFIEQGLKSGVIDHGTYQYTMLGTLKGGLHPLSYLTSTCLN
jgi:retron-type reverse transcriptase